MAIREFKRVAAGEWEGTDLAGQAVYALRRSPDGWDVDVFTAAETSGDPWLWGDNFASLAEALSEIPVLPEACQQLLRGENALPHQYR
jgi:hypothetical protein